MSPDPTPYRSEYSTGQKIRRQLWRWTEVAVFRWSPRVAFGWRRWVLRRFGASVGDGVKVEPSVTFFDPALATLEDHVVIGDGVDFYNVGPIRIGRATMVSRYARLCSGSHDFRSPSFDLLKPPIDIGSDVWICAGAFVGPGVTVGDRAVVGAHAVVMRDVPATSIVAGNPGRVVGDRDTSNISSERVSS